jgi:hypothetical protein
MTSDDEIKLERATLTTPLSPLSHNGDEGCAMTGYT